MLDVFIHIVNNNISVDFNQEYSGVILAIIVYIQ